jgi:hypothetical protein
MLCSERAAAYGAVPLRVLEVGAGDGRLAHHLQAALRAAAPPGGAPAVELFATDSDARGLRGGSPCGALVEVAACDAALLARVAPHLVLACWHPFGCDWTACFRAAPSVREYVLVGEADDGICGLPWETWGCTRHGGGGGSSGSSSESSESSAEAAETGEQGRKRARRMPPYLASGFARVELPQLSRWQLCRTDERWRPRGASRTVAFRRRDASDAGAVP